MKGDFHLVELCCGSAALTLHLLGAKRQIVPYQGSKWDFRTDLEGLLHRMGHRQLKQISLNDIGPWGRTWQALSYPMGLAITKAKLEVYAERDPRELYDELQGAPIEGSGAAEHLFLQRLAFSGKAVGTVAVEGDKRWKSPGFNKTSAYGREGTAKFGRVKPMIPSLIGVLGQMQELGWPSTRVSQLSAEEVLFPRGRLPVVAYIDPPYVDTTTYPNGDLDRAAVVELALRWADAGATVIVSEREPITELHDHGFASWMMRVPSDDGKPFQSKDAEVVTYRTATS